jgi:hypothetical protein
MLRALGFLAVTIFGLSTVLATVLATVPATAQTRPVVVELFTSQGCSSCPPADANLIRLMARPDVLALSFGVTYWNDLGWDDTFSQPIFTDRQFAYERKLGHESAFTPQMVIDGTRDTVGHDLGEIEQLIAKAATEAANGPAIDVADGKLTIGVAATPAPPADIWVVEYAPEIAEVPVARGENRRRVLRIGHPVRSLTHLGQWSGAAITLALPASEPGREQAVLLQAKDGGPILGAARI